MHEHGSKPHRVDRLAWTDQDLGQIDAPKRPMKLRAGFGSGLSRGKRDQSIWAIGDRGPNLKVKTAIKLYGLDQLQKLSDQKGAKIMPRPDLGPALAELRLHEDRVELVRTIRITQGDGKPVSGLPLPPSSGMVNEPAFDLEGEPLPSDANGLDTEGIAALADGGIWVGDEFGPSLVRLDQEGRVVKRLIPAGLSLNGSTYPVDASLPVIAARRKLNRGFEALSLSPGEEWLFLAFQSPLAHPDDQAHEAARHVRIWKLEAGTGHAVAQYAYPLDEPQTFVRDSDKEEQKRSDLKVSELIALSSERLLVLERASETTKIYSVTIDETRELDPLHLAIDHRPTLEELSLQDDNHHFPALRKELVFTTDDAVEIAADLEGMVVLNPSQLLLVNDNDFGVEGAETSFWRITFEEEVLR